MKYIREFENHSQYEAFIATSAFVKPNISYCVQENEVHHNPWTDPRVIAKFNVTDTANPTIITYSPSAFSAAEIDGVEQESVGSGYTFDTLGEHTVKYTLTNPTSIPATTFNGCTRLTSVIIPDSVTTINSSSFSGCYNLLSVIFHKSSQLNTVGDYVFTNCSSLTSFDFPSTTRTIGIYTFYECTNIESINIPNEVTFIGRGTFGGCTKLKRVNSDIDGIFNLPSSLTFIGYRFFYNCPQLISVEIPSSVTNGNIPNDSQFQNTFENCTNLLRTNIPSSIKFMGQMTFAGCSSLTSVTFDEGSQLEDLGYQLTFYNCRSLLSIEIPSNVTHIGNNAFVGCSSLTSIIIKATIPPSVSSNSFNNENQCPIYVPSASVDAYKEATNWSAYASRIQAIP